MRTRTISFPTFIMHILFFMLFVACQINAEPKGSSSGNTPAAFCMNNCNKDRCAAKPDILSTCESSCTTQPDLLKSCREGAKAATSDQPPHGMADYTNTPAGNCMKNCDEQKCRQNHALGSQCKQWCIGPALQTLLQQCLKGILAPSMSSMNQPPQAMGGMNQPSHGMGSMNQPSHGMGGMNQPPQAMGGMNQPPANWESTETKRALCKEKCIKGSCHNNNDHRNNCSNWCIGSDQRNVFSECIEEVIADKPPQNWVSTEEKAALCKEKCIKGSCVNDPVHREKCVDWCIGSDQRSILQDCKAAVEEAKSDESSQPLAPLTTNKYVYNPKNSVSTGPLTRNKYDDKPTSKAGVEENKGQENSVSPKTDEKSIEGVFTIGKYTAPKKLFRDPRATGGPSFPTSTQDIKVVFIKGKDGKKYLSYEPSMRDSREFVAELLEKYHVNFVDQLAGKTVKFKPTGKSVKLENDGTGKSIEYPLVDIISE